MAKERVTLKEIARQLGVSVPTVSRALKDYPDISKETKKKVLKLVDKLHYVPNVLATNLRKSKSNIIGVIIPKVVHFFFSSVVNGIMNCAEDHGYSVLLTISDEKLAMEKKQAKLLFSSHVDGLLVCLSDESETFDHFKPFKKFDIPLVLFDKVNSKLRASQIIVNDKEGAYQATEHLIHQGCKRILFITGINNPLNAQERYHGYKDAIEAYNGTVEESLVKRCEISRQESQKLVEQCLNDGLDFDGIFCVSDILAVGALCACLDMGVKVPEDVCIVGFSDSEMCAFSRPKLSSMFQPDYEMGRRAVEQLISEISSVEKEIPYKPQKVVLETSLKIRESSNRLLVKR